MFLIVDLIIVSIIALCVIIGYRRGLAGCIIKIVSFFLALIVAAILFKPVANMVVNNTQMDENLKTSIVEVFEEENNDSEENSENTEKEDDESISPIVKYISDEVENATEEKKTEIVNSVATKLAINIINIITFIALFRGARIALIFVRAITNLITKLPLIKECDKIGGIIYGILHGFIIVFIGLALITFVSTIVNNYKVLEMINNSNIGNVLNNNNILIKLIF